jgi:hypothetical protein
VVVHDRGRGYVRIDLATGAEQPFATVPGWGTVLARPGRGRVWTQRGHLPGARSQPTQGSALGGGQWLVVDEHDLRSGRSRRILDVDAQCRDIQPTTHPDIFFMQLKGRSAVFDASEERLYSWPAHDLGVPESERLQVLPSRQAGVVVSRRSPQRVVLVDWRHGRSTLLWEAPSGAEVGQPYLSPDGQRVVTLVQHQTLDVLEYAAGYMVLGVDGTEHSRRWAPIGGLSAMWYKLWWCKDGGPWLDADSLLAVTTRYLLGPDLPAGNLDLYRLSLDR